ncbi:MAG: sterol desaturase family protein [Deltaproteobacteria bacterium]|nr:sterol desaturase family protein [Deltaproteobacteria bacterium]
MLGLEMGSVRSLLTLFGYGLFLGFELLIPYRKPSVSKTGRWVNNLTLTLLNSVVMYLLFAALIVHTAQYVTDNRLGVLNLADIPRWTKIVITVLIMDFVIYVWHLLNHEAPFFWRFHRVHHSDLNMDVSTSTRFHIGELAMSAVIKISLILFLGAELIAVIVFETLLVFCAQFCHSSLRVPPRLDSLLWILFVPPSMHRIHHSVVIKERNTNYGTILSVWDRWLGTLRKDVDQAEIRIGVGAYNNPEEVALGRLLIMPFTRSVL